MRNLFVGLFLFLNISAWAQTTAFTYQGRLQDNGSPGNGVYDLQFRIYDAVTNGNPVSVWQTNSAVAVSNGLFTTQLDFGANVFNGSERWLEIGVRTNGGAGFGELTPRQQIAATPYAISANAVLGSVPTSQLTGTVPLSALPAVVLTNNSIGVTLTGSFIGNGSGLTNVNAATLNGLASTAFSTNRGFLNVVFEGNGGGTVSGPAIGLTSSSSTFVPVTPGTVVTLTASPDSTSTFAGWSGACSGTGACNFTMGNGVTTVRPVFQRIMYTLTVNRSGAGLVVSDPPGIYCGGVCSVAVPAGTFVTLTAYPEPGVTFNGWSGGVCAGTGPCTAVMSANRIVNATFVGTPTYQGAFSGNGANITNLNAMSISSGNLDDARLSTNIAKLNASQHFSESVSFNAASGTFSGNGAGLTNVNAATLGGVTANGFWQTAGNAGASNAFLGTLDLQPLEFRVNNTRALRLEYQTDGSSLFPNVIAGAPNNSVQSFASAISGGEANSIGSNAFFSTIGGGSGNQVMAGSYSGTVNGGDLNKIYENAPRSSIGGGSGNIIQTNASHATIGGGLNNTIDSGGNGSTIGGGGPNNISAPDAVIGGGEINIIGAAAQYAVIGGGSENLIESNAVAAVVAGGYGNVIGTDALQSVISGGAFNTIESNSTDSVIGGGTYNHIQPDSGTSTISGGTANQVFGPYSTLSGGANNTIRPGANATIGGGFFNLVDTNANYATISGGQQNTIGDTAADATIAGGQYNHILANAAYGTIGGGLRNTNTGMYATIPGGRFNVAGTRSFAAGYRAKAANEGSFVWADTTEADFTTTATNQFLIRATSGVGINKNNPATALDVNGTVTATAFSGSGANLSGLNPTNISGTLPDARLSTNVVLTTGKLTTSFTPTGGTSSNAALSVRPASAATANSYLLALDSIAGTTKFSVDAEGDTTVAGSMIINGGTAWHSGNDGSASGLDADTVDGLDSTRFWKLGGNAGTTPGTDFIGTTDNQALEFKVNGSRVLRLVPGTSSPNTVGGYFQNYVTNVSGATIGGGGYISEENGVLSDYGTIAGGAGNLIDSSSINASIGGGFSNTIETNANSGTIAGGYDNTIKRNAVRATIGGGNGNTVNTNASYSTIAGGDQNHIFTDADHGLIGGGRGNTIGNNSDYSSVVSGQSGVVNSTYSTIGGGFANTIGTNANYSVIAGGNANVILTNSPYGTISGGNNNTISTNSSYSTIGGGLNNQILTNSYYATIPGGRQNIATNNAFAAGYNAQATNSGAFVWSDSSGNVTASTNNNSVTFRALGGYRFLSAAGNVGMHLAPGSGAWASMSDRNAKENIEQVDSRAVLEKVAALPIATWNYKTQDASTRHIGPMAQDFAAAFGVGENETTITTVDADGVALAAIQGLNQKLEAQNKSLKEKDAQIESLQKRLERLEKLVSTR